ncbi:hypothetical protein KKF84_15400 [Myxococcota bacterium]|nr:hypothetical protein [Myxococcota bacterium]MBU1536709.1 hypothetical protein [Myxococcota bacterium]
MYTSLLTYTANCGDRGITCDDGELCSAGTCALTCQNLANAAGLSGTFMAWLIDDTESPSTRFYLSNVPSVLTTGNVVAYNWTDLTDGAINRGINRTQTGALYNSSMSIATGTNAAGTAIAGTNCQNWTSASNAYSYR